MVKRMIGLEATGVAWGLVLTYTEIDQAKLNCLADCCLEEAKKQIMRRLKLAFSAEDIATLKMENSDGWLFGFVKTKEDAETHHQKLLGAYQNEEFQGKLVRDMGKLKTVIQAMKPDGGLLTLGSVDKLETDQFKMVWKMISELKKGIGKKRNQAYTRTARYLLDLFWDAFREYNKGKEIPENLKNNVHVRVLLEHPEDSLYDVLYANNQGGMTAIAEHAVRVFFTNAKGTMFTENLIASLPPPDDSGSNYASVHGDVAALDDLVKALADFTGEQSMCSLLEKTATINECANKILESDAPALAKSVARTLREAVMSSAPWAVRKVCIFTVGRNGCVASFNKKTYRRYEVLRALGLKVPFEYHDTDQEYIAPSRWLQIMRRIPIFVSDAAFKPVGKQRKKRAKAVAPKAAPFSPPAPKVSASKVAPKFIW